MFPTLKNNKAADYQGPVKIEVLKGAGLLRLNTLVIQTLWSVPLMPILLRLDY